MFKSFFLPRLIYIVYRLLYLTWKIDVRMDPEFISLYREKMPTIVAHFHGDELALLHLVKKYKFSTMTSTSKDGALINYVVKKLGGMTSRGSSTRGGVAALKGLVKIIKRGFPASIAVDGPKGPIHIVKPGIFEISRLSGATIFALSAASNQYWVSEKSWNKAILPKPFSRVVIVFKKVYSPISRQQNPKDPQLAKDLAWHITDTRQQAAKLIAAE